MAASRSADSDGPRSKRAPRHLMPQIFLGVLGLVAAAATVTTMQYGDTKLSKLFSSLDLPGDLDKALQVSEVFAHGSGVIAILATLGWIDVKNRRMIGFAAGMTLFSSLLANSLKNIFSRVRPHSGDAVDAVESWLPLLHGSFWDSTQRSFPSGHSATAVALAIGLSSVYPRGRLFFATFAALACAQRVVSQAHYPSDVLAGMSIAFLCCSLCLRWKPECVV